MATWILTPCKRSRGSELLQMLGSLGADDAHTVIVSTLPDPIGTDDFPSTFIPHFLTFTKPGMLFGEWFNLGLDYIAELAGPDPYEVLMIGSSLTGTLESVDILRAGMRDCDMIMVGPDLHGRLGYRNVQRIDQEPRTVYDRVPGMCMMVAGEIGLRFDPQFRWWYADDSFEMEHRARGRVGLIGGSGITYPAEHMLSAEQAIWAEQDRQRFVNKYGMQAH